MDTPADDTVNRKSGRYRLALRLMFHEVRTGTIAALTGFSLPQLKLLRQRWGIAWAVRHRGQAPTSLKRLIGSRRSHQEGAALAAFCRVYGALPAGERAAAPRGEILSADRVERLCTAYEAYRACFPGSAFKFDEALNLVNEIAKNEVIGLSECSLCGVTMLIDRLAPPRTTCARCHRQSLGRRSRSRRCVRVRPSKSSAPR